MDIADSRERQRDAGRSRGLADSDATRGDGREAVPADVDVGPGVGDVCDASCAKSRRFLFQQRQGCRVGRFWFVPQLLTRHRADEPCGAVHGRRWRRRGAAGEQSNCRQDD